ncbi:hypothetical protein C7447_101403 [Tenacibaculum adriaticum]|uniref:Uncharacterized protein n=1 Tax=Tenacibaculum adriaticum TaxID=413713 RepID=A0A5S5DX08_9FLAO|nr:hypothetical protein [Tenacibaculum adriaticum]TYP99798.1 hypothetical protein C7447_101403 [Tenacibaculum adriaticum]
MKENSNYSIKKIMELYKSYPKKKRQIIAISLSAFICITALNLSYEFGEVCGELLYNITH